MKTQISYGNITENPKSGTIVCPAFCDPHVHFRQPGFEYKETILSGSRAAAAGGYGCVCTMPNLNPVPDSPATLALQTGIIERDAVIDVRPYASITMGRKGLEIVDFGALRDSVVAFSDDGSGVQDERVMRRAMELAASQGCIIAAHCEDNSLGTGPESEWRQIARDLDIAGDTGCAYHVCHISTKESVDIIRRAKDRGVDVSCETAPHYLLLDRDCLRDDGRFRMNPPLRSRADREAIVAGLLDGTVDMIATDHAPHSAEEKSKGLQGSAMGIVGLETAFPVLYTGLVRTGILSLGRLVELMSAAPRRRFALPMRPDDYVEINLDEAFTIDSSRFLSKGRSTPFDGLEVYGKVVRTVYKGKTVYSI